MINNNRPTPKEMLEIITPCTKSILDCEVMRTAIHLRPTEEHGLNEIAQEIRTGLGEYACRGCFMQYLSDVETDIALKDRPFVEEL